MFGPTAAGRGEPSSSIPGLRGSLILGELKAQDNRISMLRKNIYDFYVFKINTDIPLTLNQYSN